MNANHVKFTEEYMMGMEKHVLIKKMFANRLNMDLSILILSQKDSLWIGNILTPVKKKFWLHLVMLTIFWDMKDPLLLKSLKEVQL